MMQNSLMTYYERIFALIHYHKWSMSEIGDLFPWELDVMVALLSNYIEKVEQDRKQAQLNRTTMR